VFQDMSRHFIFGAALNFTDVNFYEDGTDRGFRKMDTYSSDAGELPGRKNTTFRTRRKFEIKNEILVSVITFSDVVTASLIKKRTTCPLQRPL
jgi:hypothetical protein